MNLTSWLGLGFLVLLVVIVLAVLVATLKKISASDLDDASKSKWGLLFGLSPGAGLYAWHKRDELITNGDDSGEDSGHTEPEARD